MNQLFYTPRIENGFVYIGEEESRHLLAVLRRKVGDPLQTTDGRGNFYETEITETGKRHAVARIISTVAAPAERPFKLHLAIAPTKQIERFEWLLEKATEIGIDEISPLLCKHSERTTIRVDRLEKILVSAMKQSLRASLPKLNELTPFQSFVKAASGACKRIAWCTEANLPHLSEAITPGSDIVIAIGPEGDFSQTEIDLALEHGFTGVSLGAARLRTETAGIMAVAAVNLALV